MKKILLLLTCMSAIVAHSQRKFGIIAGIDNPMFTQGVLEQISYQTATGIQVGVFYEMELNRSIHFRPRLIYSQQGDRATEAIYPSYIAESGIDYRLNYINVPLDIKFWNKVYVILGPQIGFLVSEKAAGPKFDGPAKSSIDFGANLALGVSFKQTFLELGVYQGLVPAIEVPLGGRNREYHNALIRFSIGWRIY